MASAMFHSNIIHGGMSGADTEALIDANTEAISLSNEAGAAYYAGRYNDAIRLNQEALRLKLRAYPEDSIQAAISYSALGEALLYAGRLQEADTALAKALAVRERAGPAQDLAATRESIGALREAQGRFPEAREIRVKGDAGSNILCGNDRCPTNKMSSLSQLKTCGACQSVFYCDRHCQKQDWLKRHKPFCQARSAGVQAGN